MSVSSSPRFCCAVYGQAVPGGIGGRVDPVRGVFRTQASPGRAGDGADLKAA
jgi:hypothetical protein